MSIEDRAGQLFIDGQEKTFKIEKKGDSRYVIVSNNKVYDLEVILSENGRYKLSIDGNLMNAEVLDQEKLILKEMGFDSSHEEIVNELASPMPGTIIELKCAEGDQLKKGDPILILEAMKMENVIKAPADVTVRKIKVHIGENVEKNQTLVLF